MFALKRNVILIAVKAVEHYLQDQYRGLAISNSSPFESQNLGTANPQRGWKKSDETRTRMKSCLRMRIPGKLVRTRASCACSNPEEVPMPISLFIQRDKTLLHAFILSFPPAPRQFSPAYLETPLLLSSIVG